MNLQTQPTNGKSQTVKSGHYRGRNGLRSVDVCEQFELCGHRWQAVEYLLRAAKKEGGEFFCRDIAKAAWWCLRILSNHGQKKEIQRLLTEFRLDGHLKP